MNDEFKIAFYGMYRACLAATGAYDALKLVGAHKHLPGFDNCFKELNDAIDKAKTVMEALT